ncbi:hypothetical protein V2W30_14370 [Streptomyces sp. Q6]|uniref:Uncharacterized protein n=1 Tax=Streptomyces citrinus TaxID=3118173 RepID=A0ACD5ABG8_9ACTN
MAGEYGTSSDAAHGPDDSLGGAGPLRVWVPPVVANLALGIPALVPLFSLSWLLTNWFGTDCARFDELTAAGATPLCDYHTLDHGPVIMALAVVSALLLTLFVVLSNRGLARRRPTGVCPRTVPLVLLPFAALWTLT